MSNSTTCDIDAIRSRSEDLKSIEENLRRGREQTGETRWPFGDMILATLDDVKNLVARVAELEAALAARRDSPSILSAVLGSLRADGYQVTAPGKRSRAEEDAADREDSARELFDPDAVAGDMLADDEPDDGTGPTLGEVIGTIDAMRLCPSCEKPLPPDGKCLSPYVDCQKASAPPVEPTKPTPLGNGASLRLAGGVWDGRYAIALGTISGHGHRHCVQVVARGAELAGARTIDAAMVFVVNPAVDEPIAKTGPIQPPSDAPTTPAEPARKRAEEPPVAIADWTLTDKDIAEVAAKLSRTVDEIKRLVAAFKVAMKDRAPTPRWRPAFNAWAAKNAAAVLAQATAPGT